MVYLVIYSFWKGIENMNSKTAMNWKIFWLIFMMAEISMFAALPYSLSISGDLIYSLGTSLPLLLATQFAQGTALIIISIVTGLYLGNKLGLRTPLLKSLFQGRGLPSNFKSSLKISVLLGLFLSIIMLLVDKFIFSVYMNSLISFISSPPLWQRFMYSFYAGIVEEIILRYFLVTILVWITWKIKRTPEDLPTNVGVWLSIIIVSIIYTLGNILSLSDSLQFNIATYLGYILLNLMAGSIFGWLYWKKGLESAIIANLTATLMIFTVISSLLPM